MHIQRLFQLAVGNSDFIAESPPSGNRSRRAMKARKKPAVLHRGIDFQADFIAELVALEILAEGNFSPFAVMPLKLMAGLALLGTDAFDHILLHYAIRL